MKVYLDNGATTKVDELVLKQMMPYFTNKYGNASSIHSLGSDARRAVEEAREKIGAKIGANHDEIIFTSGGTESDNLAITGAAHAFGKGHIITTNIEHPAVLGTCWMLERDGFSVSYLDVDKNGYIDLKTLEKEIRKDTIIVSIMHANNEIGVVQDLEKIGKLIRKKREEFNSKTYFHTDAVQSFLKVDLDVDKFGLDLVSLSGHKIHGPKGVGVLYARKGTELSKIIHGGSQEYKLRAGTENVAGIVGFSAATDLSDKGNQIRKLRDRLIKGLLEINGTWLNGPVDRLCNNANISFKNIEGESILLHLDMEGISVSTGSACSSKSLKPSHVLTAIGLKPEDAHGSIRFTLSRYTTKEEIDYTIEKTKDVVSKLRKISPFKG